MSKKRKGLGGLAALGGAALLAMKMAKGDRKDAAPIEDAMKKDSKSSLTDDMRKRGEADTDVSGIEKYARETGIGTMRQPARDVPARSAARPAARPSAQAPAVVPRTPAVGRAEGMSASGFPREARGVQPPRSLANQFFGDDMRPMAIRARELARQQEFEPLRSGMKKGGAVKKKMKSGGTVSKASKRADGCVIKGKTRGRMV